MDLDHVGADTTLDGQDEMTSTIKARNPLPIAPNVAPGASEYSGTVTILGSYATRAVDGDWDEDVSFPKDGLGRATVRPKTSFSSQISDHVSEDDTFQPRSRAKLSSSSVETEADLDFEKDFDLPESLSRVSLMPTLARPPSRPPSSIDMNRPVTPYRQASSTTSSPQSRLLPPRSGLRSSASSMSPQSSDEPADDLFDDLVLPPFFGGPGVVTPPQSAKGKGKLSLQEILQAKLEARLHAGRRGDDDRRRGHGNVYDDLEEGLVIDDTVDWAKVKSPGSRRTERAPVRNSSKQGKSDRAGAPKAKGTTSSSAAAATSSRKDVQTSPVSRGRRSPAAPIQQPISPISPVYTRPSGPRPRPANPRSRLGEGSTSTSQATSASASTPKQANPPRTLKYKKSTSVLQSSTASPRTLSHKRSLPSLSDAASSHGHGHGHGPSSPSVASPRLPSSLQQQRQRSTATPRAATASYAQPTLASQIRHQQPSTPTMMEPVRRYGRLQESPPVPPARPSTPASPSAVRITVPTLSSRLKQRTPVSLASDPFGRTFASLGQPVTPSTSPTSAPVKVMRNPKRQRQYGDGTELDGFDDLPTNKEKERRFMKEVAGGSGTVRKAAVSKDMKKALKELKKKTTTDKTSKPRKQPHLIRSLTAAGLAKGWLPISSSSLFDLATR
jgi:hypothetical protein